MATQTSLRVRIDAEYFTRLNVWLPKINATLWVQDGRGDFQDMVFRVDCGAMVTRIPEGLVSRRQLPAASAEPAIEITEDTAAGKRTIQARRGRLLVRFTPTEPDTPFLIPVQYVEAAPAQGLAPGKPTALLGLAGVIDQMSWLLDGIKVDGFPHGSCLLDDTR